MRKKGVASSTSSTVGVLLKGSFLIFETCTKEVGSDLDRLGVVALLVFDNRGW